MMINSPAKARSSYSLKRADLLILLSISTSVLLYHILTSALSGYGYFIDEFYYIACSKRLAFGYVDHPPLSIVILAFSRWLLGDSIVAVRFFSSLAASATVFVTGCLARRLGGDRYAIVIAALAAFVMPVNLLMGSFYSMNAFEPLIWSAILYCAIVMVQEENPRYFLLIGSLMGVGLEMKHTMVLYGIALVIGMLLTTGRRFIWNKWFVWGLAACALLVIPNLVWQYQHGFPSLEFYKNAMQNKNIPTGPLAVVFGQIIFANPLPLPLWLIGLGYCFFMKEGRRYRFLGWAYLFLLAAIVLTQSSRPDRIAAIYLFLFAAGAVSIGNIQTPAAKRWIQRSVVAMLFLGGILAAPIFTPLLPPPILAKYLSTLGISFNLENGKVDEPVPQWLADRLGWHELAMDVSSVYHALPAEEQKNTVIISTNYGEAGALELYGPEFDLPPVFATHNSYHSWGPPPDSVTMFIAVFVERRDLEKKFSSVAEALVHTCQDCTRQQRSIPIYVARDPNFSMSAEWQHFKIFN